MATTPRAERFGQGWDAWVAFADRTDAPSRIEASVDEIVCWHRGYDAAAKANELGGNRPVIGEWRGAEQDIQSELEWNDYSDDYDNR